MNKANFPGELSCLPIADTAKLTFILIFDALEIYKGSIKRSDCVLVEKESLKI